jgi:hypothetical protein
MTNTRRYFAPSRRTFLGTASCFSLMQAISFSAVMNAARGAEETHELQVDPAQPAAPEWIKELIIYEVATKGFTSPHGPGSGTFASLQSRLSYLHQLGITGIWLTGYSLCDPHHFYNIWTQYAVIEPDRFDPGLGTAQEFKDLVDTAHRLGIKVFLDVITHGLMKKSPIVSKHPGWFRGGSWGMADFDWSGGHTDLDEWWIKIYSDYVTVYGVDGYRLDVSIYRPDLWERIRRNAAAAGHPIVIWEEGNSAIHGVTDFAQRDNLISTDTTRDNSINELLANDLPAFYYRKFGRSGAYKVRIEYEDSSSLNGSTRGDGPLGVRLIGLSADRVGARWGEESPQPDGLPDVQLRLENVLRKPIANIIVRSETGEQWQLRGGRLLYVDAPASLGALVVGPAVDIYIATLSWGGSVQLSCHDNGWEGFPRNMNPFVAKGSRSLFGYSFLLSPMIPIFFSGEEFDAAFHPLPDLSPNLYGGQDPGKGRWLYGAMLDWNELKQPNHEDMFKDVQRMISIRKENPKVLAITPAGQEPKLRAVEHTGSMKVPVPYLRWENRSAILVAANRNREQDAMIKVRVNLEGTGIESHERYAVVDLWSGSGTKIYTASELNSFGCTVKRDGTRGGGLSIFRIEPA